MFLWHYTGTHYTEIHKFYHLEWLPYTGHNPIPQSNAASMYFIQPRYPGKYHFYVRNTLTRQLLELSYFYIKEMHGGNPTLIPCSLQFSRLTNSKAGEDILKILNCPMTVGLAAFCKINLSCTIQISLIWGQSIEWSYSGTRWATVQIPHNATPVILMQIPTRHSPFSSACSLQLNFLLSWNNF